MALFPAGGIAQGDEEVFGQWDCCGGGRWRLWLVKWGSTWQKHKMGRNSANCNTHRPADGSIRCRRRRARGWGGPSGDGTAVGEGGVDYG